MAAVPREGDLSLTRSHAPTPLTGRFYGEDVNLELPYTERDNPYFVGCLDRGA